MLQTFRNAWRIEELRKKILFTLLIVLLYRLGNAVPVPFVDTKALADYFQSSGLQNTILGLFNVCLLYTSHTTRTTSAMSVISSA